MEDKSTAFIVENFQIFVIIQDLEKMEKRYGWKLNTSVAARRFLCYTKSKNPKGE